MNNAISITGSTNTQPLRAKAAAEVHETILKHLKQSGFELSAVQQAEFLADHASKPRESLIRIRVLSNDPLQKPP